MSVTAVDQGPRELFGARAQLGEVQSRSVGGGAAMVLTSIANQGVRFAATLILARLLTPADFGVFAVVMAFAGVGGLFWELGLATATVQAGTVTPPQVSAMFWINVGCAACVTLIATAGAGWLGRAYGDPRIEAMCRWLAFSPLLAALGMQHLALLQRALKFRETAFIGAAATAVGSALTVLLALRGLGFVALAAGVLATNAVSTLAAWSRCRWLPGPFKLDAATRAMLAFGGQLVGFGILGAVAGGLHSALLGLVSGTGNAGLYFRASSLIQIFQGLTLGTLATVVTAALSHLKDRPAEFRDYYLACTALLCTLYAPAAALGWLFSSELLAVVYGPQWAASAPPFAVLSLGIVWYALSYSTGWIYVSRGDGQRMMRWGLLGWTLVIIGTLIGLPLGLRGLAIAQTVTVGVVFVPCMTMAFHGTGIGWAALGRSVWRPLAAALVAWSIVWPLSGALPSLPVLRLVTGTGVFGLIYLLVLSELLGQRAQLLAFIQSLRGRSALEGPAR